jgi:hypothetical protein
MQSLNPHPTQNHDEAKHLPDPAERQKKFDGEDPQ